MKKTLLAAALAVGFAGVAQAETSVTLYGIIDTGIAYDQVKTDGGKTKSKKFGLYDGTFLGQAGSRWGLRGVEDLGNGLRAVFQLESGFDVTTGKSMQGGRLFGRNATLGLHSDSWGQIDVGRQTNIASKYLMGMIDPFGGGFGTANGGQTFTSSNTVRWDNTIIYQTPNFSGFQFGIGYSFNTGGSQHAKVSGQKDKNNRGFTTGLKYANGPLAVALTYDQVSNSAAKAANRDNYRTIREWALGGSYDFEVVKVHAAFGQARGGQLSDLSDQGYPAFEKLVDAVVAGNQADIDAAVASGALGYKSNKDGRINKYLLGLSAPVGGGTLMASWSMADPNKKWSADKDTRKTQHVYGLGYKYPLSKRTDVYAYAAQVKNQKFVRKNKQSTFAVGMTHRF